LANGGETSTRFFSIKSTQLPDPVAALGQTWRRLGAAIDRLINKSAAR